MEPADRLAYGLGMKASISDETGAVLGSAPSATLLLTGERHLAVWRGSLEAADPHGAVRGPAQILCCALAALAEEAARAVGRPIQPAGHAAAGLALLTKLDDEVIDASAFHGGPSTDRVHLQRRTERFLAPTLQAVCGRAQGRTTGRVALAAEVGEALGGLASPDSRGSLPALHDLLARGWAIQVEAVQALSAEPGTVPLAHLAQVTSGISGAWLAMITAAGLVGARSLTPAEERAFFTWGLYIQSADALADLDKDLADRFANTLPLNLAIARDPSLMADWRRGDGGALRVGLVRTGADVAVLPEPSVLDALDRAFADLGEVSSLLRWIHGFLLGRYVQATPSVDAAVFAPYLCPWEAFARTHAPERSCSA